MKTCLFTIALALFFCQVAQAQSEYTVAPGTKMKESEGKEFWLCFMRNYREVAAAEPSDPLTLQLFFTSNENARVRIEIEGLSYQRTINVKGGTVATLVVDEQAQLNAVATPQRLAIHVTADVPITVYGLNRRYQTTDTYLALPVSVLGKEYRAVCYSNLSQDLVSQIAVVATEDNTVLTITPRCSVIGGYAADQTYTMRMQKGEAYQIVASSSVTGGGDLTGTLIRSSSPVSVFSGHSCAYVPAGIQACNHLVEQLPPVTAWGKQFYIGMLKGRSRYTVRVVAHESRTKVFEDSKLVAVLNAGDFYEMVNVRKHVQVTADRPILVAQYSQGFKNGDSLGDPMMILVSPTQQFVNKYRVATPVNGLWNHYINIIVPTDRISSVFLDGSVVSAAKFESFGISRFSIAQLEVGFGTHVVTGGVPFGLYSYGFGFKDDSFDAYGNMGGQSFFDLENETDTLAPVPELQGGGMTSSVIIRDDRTTDRGMKSVNIVSAHGIDLSIPASEEGAPHIVVSMRPTKDRESGSAVLRATDMAGNSKVFSLCYTVDGKRNAFGTFSLGTDDRMCTSRPMWRAGSFVTSSVLFHAANFSSAGNISAGGPFGNTTGNGGLFGLAVTRFLSDEWAVTGRLALETLGGTLRAPDSTLTRIRDSSGALLNFQEERSLALASPQLALSVLAERTLMRNLYVYAGLKTQVAMGSSVEFARHILQPQNAVYADTRQPNKTIDVDASQALRSIRFAALAGAGYTVPVSSAFQLFAEVEYVAPLSSMVRSANGTWMISALEVHIGAGLTF